MFPKFSRPSLTKQSFLMLMLYQSFYQVLSFQSLTVRKPLPNELQSLLNPILNSRNAITLTVGFRLLDCLFNYLGTDPANSFIKVIAPTLISLLIGPTIIQQTSLNRANYYLVKENFKLKNIKDLSIFYLRTIVLLF